MKLILAIVAALIGGVLLIEMDTGTLSAMQVAGVGLVCLAIAEVVS